jgi:hypothetical protein
LRFWKGPSPASESKPEVARRLSDSHHEVKLAGA